MQLQHKSSNMFFINHLVKYIFIPSSAHIKLSSEPILPIRRIRKLRRALKTPDGPLAPKDDFILVSF